jgi:hypothetical protein
MDELNSSGSEFVAEKFWQREKIGGNRDGGENYELVLDIVHIVVM